MHPDTVCTGNELKVARARKHTFADKASTGASRACQLASLAWVHLHIVKGCPNWDG